MAFRPSGAHYTYTIEEKDHVIRQELFGAYSRHNEPRRTTHDEQSNVIALECVCTNDALMMYNPLIEGK